jgi:hypothetical protein
MNKLYKISFVIFLVVSLISLTACGGHGGGGNNNSTPEAISEMTAVRLSLGAVVDNITDIIGYTPNSVREVRASITISDKLKDLAKGEIINKIIPSNSINEFMTGKGANDVADWIKSPTYLNESNKKLVLGYCDKYEENQRYNVALYEAKEGAGTILTKIVTLPTETAAVAVSYLNDGNGNNSTFVFVIKQNGEFEGRTFKGTNDTVTFDSDNNSAFVYGKDGEMTYHNDESFEVVKLDGTKVSSSSPLIEAFKSAINTLKIAGQLRTGKDGKSDSATIKENQLTQIPQILVFLGDGDKLDQYMNYSTIEEFINDNNITNKFLPKYLEDYEKVRIGDYNGNLPYYSGATAEATLRLALSVIDKDSAHIVTKVAGQDDGLYIVAISYLTVNEKEYTVAVGAQMIKGSNGIFLEAKMFEGKHNDVNYQSTDNEKRNIKVIGTAKVDYVTEEDIPGTITVNGKTITFNAAE